MKVPTWDEIEVALRIPEVNVKTDAMGRVIRKKNYSQTKVNKGFNVGKPKGKGKYD